ncbi:MAG: J domain-containing protein [Thermodesulfobacteriota bacterium]|nr:J domain-containing protein [Thermodesulfobacteriota bacterium]
MPQVTETEVIRACRTLFGSELQLNRDFLSYLQPAGVRTAYRKKAKTTHPDRFVLSAGATQIKQHRLFQDLNQAHQTVLAYLKQRKMISTGNFSPNYSAYTQAKRHRQDPPTRSQQRGSLPARPLQFGLFLYYLGIIPFSAMIAAITWQRRQRPALGEIARRWGWLNDSHIREIINYRCGVHKFGERAEKLGLLNNLQVRTLLFHQRSRQTQLGHYFVQQGYFNEITLNQLLLQLAEHNQTYRKKFGGHYYYFHRR